MIHVEDIVKRYGATVAVDHVSFDVAAGEILGFLGPNGAGKSTTLKIITSYIVADSGTVSIGGVDPLTDPQEVRRQIGYLPESTPLYTDMQVGEYLRFVTRLRGMAGAKAREAIDRVVALVGIERMYCKAIGHLSKGYRQRVGIAQSLIHDPPIIIMDEPTSGLDPHQIIEIRELIRTLGKTKLVILSSHILQEISAIGTRILIIKDGRLVADDHPDKMRASAAGKTVFAARVKNAPVDVTDALRSVEGVESVTPGDHAEEFRVVGHQDADLGAKIFRLAVDKGWTLASLSPQEHSLEEVYLSLTADDDSSRAAS
jgi:ABC-2 type transport system ATP-binding protein